MRINFRKFTLLTILSCVLLVSCGQSTSGPETWIDLPLDNSTAPLAPLTLMAHSSHIDGIARIDFYVDGKMIASQKTTGNRLESRQLEWTPPDPGTYIIEARGISTGGEEGGLSRIRVIIESDFDHTLTAGRPATTLTWTPRDTQVITITPSITPSLTPSKTPTITPSITPSITPKVEIIQPPTIPVDNTPPVISFVGVEPAVIYLELCGGFDRITRLTVQATDQVGIDHVGGTWSVGGESDDFVMNYVGASRYQVNIGPVNTTGPLYIVGSVEDTSGNWTYYETQATVKNCIE